MKRLALAFLLLGCVVTAQQAPVSPKPAEAPYFTDAFPPEEFAARRATVMKQINDAVAIEIADIEKLMREPGLSDLRAKTNPR